MNLEEHILHAHHYKESGRLYDAWPFYGYWEVELDDLKPIHYGGVVSTISRSRLDS